MLLVDAIEKATVLATGKEWPPVPEGVTGGSLVMLAVFFIMDFIELK